MKKILFNNKFGLTKAVIEGRKTQTRRITGFFDEAMNPHLTIMLRSEKGRKEFIDKKSRYKIGEEIAVAQSYGDIFHVVNHDVRVIIDKINCNNKAWSNKMFVKSEFMPHRIRITNIRLERLQDISPEDCKKEGVWFNANDKGWYYGEEGTPYRITSSEPYDWRYMAKLAYSKLIDKVSGKGTWKFNPWVFVYDFELVK